MCKGKLLAERECLSLVAGVLACWDIKPTCEWKIPSQLQTSAVSKPQEDVKVFIQMRQI